MRKAGCISSRCWWIWFFFIKNKDNAIQEITWEKFSGKKIGGWERVQMAWTLNLHMQYARKIHSLFRLIRFILPNVLVFALWNGFYDCYKTGVARYTFSVQKCWETCFWSIFWENLGGINGKKGTFAPCTPLLAALRSFKTFLERRGSKTEFKNRVCMWSAIFCMLVI